MTRSTCERLLAHFEGLDNEEQAAEYRRRLERYDPPKPKPAVKKGKSK